jgi:tetratricopeptide (TPR) repeat protein
LEEALDELARALAIEPRPEVHYTLGVIYWHQGDPIRAERSLRAAVGLEPKYFDAHYTLGAVLKSRRNWTAAAEALRRAVALRPDLPAAHYTLGQVLELSGDRAAARAHLQEADRLRERATLEHQALIATSVGIQKAQAGDPEGALTQFRRAIAVFEPYAPAHYQMGLVLRQLGQSQASRVSFERARQLNPSLVSPRDTP